MINKNELQRNTNETQALIPASVVQAGYADDNKFYVQAVLNDPATKKDINAFVRLANKEEIADYFQQVREFSPNEAQLEANILATKNEKTLDLHTQLTTKIEEAKLNGQFAGVINKDIFENRLEGMAVMIRGLNITHKLKDGTAPIGDSPDDTIYIASAQKMNFTGLVKDRNYLERLESESANEYVDLKETMVRFVLTPPTETTPAKAAAFAVKEADNINFKEIATNPTKFNKIIERNSLPTHESSPTIAREGFLDMNISAGNNFHRLTFDSTTFDGGDYALLSGEELNSISVNWNTEHEHNVSRFRAMQDIETVQNPDDKATLAKNDFMRVLLLAAEEPNAFNSFLGKVKYGDPTAFQGVTKTDFFTDPNQSPEQAKILDIVKAIADAPEKTFINVSVHEKLNISPKIEDDMADFMAASYNNSTDASSSHKLYGKSKAAQSHLLHSSLDVVRMNPYGDVKSLVIPATVASEVIATGRQELGVTQAVYAKFGFVPNPSASVDGGGNYKYDNMTHTYHDDLHVPKHTVQRSNQPVNLTTARSLELLSGDKPVNENQHNKQSRFAASFEPVSDMKIGMIDLRAGRELERSNNVTLKSSAQSAFVLTRLRHKNNFSSFAETLKEDPTRALKRFDEMVGVMGHTIGKLSKENTSHKHLKAVFEANLSGNKDSLTEGQKQLSDMLLTDKLVEIDVPDRDTGETVKRGYNFSDLTALVTEPQKGLRRAITADIAEKQVALRPEEENKYKAQRKDEIAVAAIKSLPTESKDDFTARMVEKMKSPEPANIPSLRV